MEIAPKSKELGSILYLVFKAQQGLSWLVYNFNQH